MKLCMGVLGDDETKDLYLYEFWESAKYGASHLERERKSKLELH